MKKVFFAALWFLAGVLVAWNVPAHASDVHAEFGAGETRYHIGPDGIWYQAGMPHTLNLHNRAFLLGATGSLVRSDHAGIDWHADYVNLGHIGSWCDCTTRDDLYDTTTRSLTTPTAPRAIFSGNGLVQGVKLSLAPYAEFHGWQIGTNDGLFVYRTQFVDSVYGWHVVDDTPLVNTSLTASHSAQIGKVFGFFVRHGSLSLSYDHFHLSRQQHDTVPPLWTGADVLLVTLIY